MLLQSYLDISDLLLNLFAVVVFMSAIGLILEVGFCVAEELEYRRPRKLSFDLLSALVRDIALWWRQHFPEQVFP